MVDLQRLIPGRVAELDDGAVTERPARPSLLRGGFPRPALPEAKIPEFLKAPSARRWRQTILALLPTIFAMLYFGLIASNRYVSEAEFVIRSPSKQSGNVSFGSLLQMTGLGQANDDSYSVEDYMMSRQAVRDLLAKLPLRQMYHRPGADFLSRYPSIFYGSSDEEFYRYFQWMLDVVHDGNSGITTIRVQAFNSADATRVMQTLLQLGEQKVNLLNARITADSVKVAQLEVDRSEQRLIADELALTNFRDRELMIDPTAAAMTMSKVVGELSSQQATVETEIRILRASSPLSPQIPPLQRKAAALAGQIAQQQMQISGEAGSGGLADKLSQYERLALNRKFAEKALSASTMALEAAKSEARRQQLYLERVVEPSVPDYAAKPQRIRTIATVFAFNVIFLLVIATIITGIREHSATHR